MNSNGSIKPDHGTDNSPAVSTALAREIQEFAKLSGLTPRESEIFGLLVGGVVRIKDVAERLQLSPNTVNNHINSIFTKTKSRSKSQLLATFLNAVANELARVRRYYRAPRIMVLDCDPQHADRLAKALSAEGCLVERCTARGDLEGKLAKFGPDFIFADEPSDVNEVREFSNFVNQRLPAQIYFMSDKDIKTATEGIQRLRKPIEPSGVVPTLLNQYMSAYGRLV